MSCCASVLYLCVLCVLLCTCNVYKHEYYYSGINPVEFRGLFCYVLVLYFCVLFFVNLCLNFVLLAYCLYVLYLYVVTFCISFVLHITVMALCACHVCIFIYFHCSVSFYIFTI